jgi:hypothetical protein
MKEIKWSRKLSVDDRRAYDVQQLEKRKSWKSMKAKVVAKRKAGRPAQGPTSSCGPEITARLTRDMNQASSLPDFAYLPSVARAMARQDWMKIYGEVGAPLDGPSIEKMRSIKDPAARTSYWRDNKDAIISRNHPLQARDRSEASKAKRQVKIDLKIEQARAAGYTIAS